jgi:hypothetical protein
MEVFSFDTLLILYTCVNWLCIYALRSNKIWYMWQILGVIRCPLWGLVPADVATEIGFLYVLFKITWGQNWPMDLRQYYFYIFVNCSWVATRWQQYSTHLHTNSTQNDTKQQNTQNRTYITIRIHKHNNNKIIYKIKQKHTKHTTIYTVITKTKRTWKNVINEKATKATNLIWSVYLVIILDTLLLRTSLRFTPLHYTSLHFT